MNLKKALIVDDSRLAQFVLKKMLVEQDMEVDTSESAEEALGYLSKYKPDVIFLDHTMPGMNGLEVLKVIKDNPDTAPIPVMMYTSQEDSTYMSKARELGAIEVLPKQLSPTELQQVLTKLKLSDNIGEDITVAANEPVADISDSTVSEPLTEDLPAGTLTKNKEELEKLVHDAEAALNHEAVQQRLQHKIEQQKDAFEQEISALHEKMDALIPAAESSSNRQNFWNNVFWAAIYCVTVVVFAAIYFQQKTDIQQLSVAQKRPTQETSQPATPPNRTIEQTVPPVTSNIISPQAQGNNNQQVALSSLENSINSNNQIPFGELLLGETIQANLNELIPRLQNINFSGRVNVQAHDGTFCVNTNNSGQFELAADDAPVSQCQITESSSRLADIASIGLLQLVTASNQSPDSNFIITINPLGINSPLENYPEITDKTTAGEWNTIALKNRRVETKLISSNSP